jgi:hypothetical protein
MADNIINRFLQLDNPEIARQTRNMSYADAFKTENPFSKSYQGYSPGYKGADKVGLGGYLKQGFKSLGGSFQPGSNVGGATPLTRKVAQDAARLGSKAVGLGRFALGGPFGIAALAGQGLGYGVDQIARATNTPEEYEAMKEAAKTQGGFGYFDDVDISQDAVSPTTTTQNEPMDIEGFLGTSTPQDLGFIGMAPGIKEAVGITDRNRGLSYFDPVTRTEVAAPNAQGRPSMADIAGEINENLRDLGNPTGDPRIASEEQGLSGFPGLGQVDRGFQDVLDAREARRNEIAMQQNPDYGQFFDAAPVNEPKRGIASIFGKVLGPALTLAGFPTPGKLVSAYNTVKSLQGGALGNAVSRARTGLGSLSRKMRGTNPDGTTRTQSQYEAARDARRTQNRIDNMLARKAAGKSYSEKNLSDLIGQQIAGRADKSGKGKKGGFTNPGKGSYGPHKGSGGGEGGGGGGKIVCTMMNDSYGFGNFRNKIWLKHSRDLPKEYEVGYHTIFLPLVKFAKGKGKLNKTVKKTLEHIARHRTYDLKQEMKGKTHLLGRAYRKVLEPICFITGKIKSALGRG